MTRLAHRVATCLGAVALVLAASFVSGQDTVPTARDPYAPAAISPQYVSDYPADEVRAVPSARARLVQARAVERHAERDLDNSIADVNRAFRRSEELKEALDEEKQGYAALEAARERAISPLKSNERYQTAWSLARDAGERLQQLRSPKEPNIDLIVATAKMKLDYAAAARDMELAFINTDPGVQQARTRLVAAGNRLTELRTRLADQIRTDEQILAKRKALQQARITHLTAEAYYVGIVEARDIAMNYAYYLRRYDVYRYAAQPVAYDYPYVVRYRY